MFELLLPTSGEAVFWPMLVLVGVLLGMVSSALGIGSGVVAVPILYALYGVEFPIAVGSSMALLVGFSALGVHGHARKKNVDFPLGLSLGGGVAAGALLGGLGLKSLSGRQPVVYLGREHDLAEVVGALLFSLLLIWLGTMTLRKVMATTRTMRAGGVDEQEQARVPRPAWLDRIKTRPLLRLSTPDRALISIWPVLIVGLIAGLFVGMLGIGGGFLMVPVLLYWFRLKTLQAVGTSLLGILLGAGIGTVQKAFQGSVDWILVLTLMAGGAFGIPMGIWIAIRVPPHELRRGFAGFCFLGVLLTLGKVLS